MLTRQDDRLYGLRRLSSEIQVGLKLVVAVRSIHRVILYLDPTGLLAPPGGSHGETGDTGPSYRHRRHQGTGSESLHRCDEASPRSARIPDDTDAVATSSGYSCSLELARALFRRRISPLSPDHSCPEE